jgi:predicted SAM-dependent methyltransferase
MAATPQSSIAEFRDYALNDDRSATDYPRERRAAIKSMVPSRWRAPLRVAATRAMRPINSLRARRLLRARTEVRLHLGAGFKYEPGWINVDLIGPKTDLAWDLSHPLPLPADSVDAIFHQNIIEYFTLGEALYLTEQCRRVLRPEGVLRLAAVDGAKSVRLYSEGQTQAGRDAPTPMLSLDAMFYGQGHRIIYDSETLLALCRAAGFANAEVSEFGAGRLSPNIDVDEPSRRETSIYVEAWG